MPISNTKNSLVLLAYSSISLLGKSDEEQMMGYAIFDNDRWVLWYDYDLVASRGLCF